MQCNHVIMHHNPEPKPVVTFEESVYTCTDFNVIFQLLDAALANPAQAQFLVAVEIARFRGRGGVSRSICRCNAAFTPLLGIMIQTILLHLCTIILGVLTVKKTYFLFCFHRFCFAHAIGSVAIVLPSVNQGAWKSFTLPCCQ